MGQSPRCCKETDLYAECVPSAAEGDRATIFCLNMNTFAVSICGGARRERLKSNNFRKLAKNSRKNLSKIWQDVAGFLSLLAKVSYSLLQQTAVHIMKAFIHARPAGPPGFALARSTPGALALPFRRSSLAILLVAVSNLATFWLTRPGTLPATPDKLYLMQEASIYVEDPPAFEGRVREVANALHVPAEWLMAVMYSESRFDPHVRNRKGSGAIGLIQWMPFSARELGTSTQELATMTAVEQLDYVEDYLQQARERYGEYHSLADLYLAILFPKARGEEACYVMYELPSVTYRQNAGLDENQDGRVTPSDIDRRMKRLYPTAWHAEL